MKHKQQCIVYTYGCKSWTKQASNYFFFKIIQPMGKVKQTRIARLAFCKGFILNSVGLHGFFVAFFYISWYLRIQLILLTFSWLLQIICKKVTPGTTGVQLGPTTLLKRKEFHFLSWEIIESRILGKTNKLGIRVKYSAGGRKV